MLYIFVLVASGCVSNPKNDCNLDREQFLKLERNVRLFENQDPDGNCSDRLHDRWGGVPGNEARHE